MVVFDLRGHNAGDVILASHALHCLADSGIRVGLAVKDNTLRPVKHMVRAEINPPRNANIFLKPAWSKGEQVTESWLRRLKSMGLPHDPQKPTPIKGDPNTVLLQPWCLLMKKRFPEKFWVEAAKLALSKEKKVVIGGPHVFYNEAQIICDKAPGTINLCGTDSGKWADTIADAGLVLSVDSGAAHVADAMGKPTVVLFNNTDPLTWAPFWDRSGVLKRPSIDRMLEILSNRLGEGHGMGSASSK